jgi:hypothetical protein
VRARWCVTGALLPALALSIGVTLIASRTAGAAPPPECKAEEATLAKDESELPRLEVASPADRPTTCITLETIIAFAARLKAHVAHCAGSSYVSSAGGWESTRVDYVKRFADNRCKRTF